MPRKALHYKGIPGVKEGVTCLSIQPPGSWFSEPRYVVFVGGCGVGSATTKKAAEQILAEHARASMERHIRDARRVIQHYETQLARFTLQPAREGQ